MDPGITRRGLEFLDEVEAQHALVPVRADPHVPHRECHVHCSIGAASAKIGSELILPVWERPGHAPRHPSRSTERRLGCVERTDGS